MPDNEKNNQNSSRPLNPQSRSQSHLRVNTRVSDLNNSAVADYVDNDERESDDRTGKISTKYN